MTRSRTPAPAPARRRRLLTAAGVLLVAALVGLAVALGAPGGGTGTSTAGRAAAPATAGAPASVSIPPALPTPVPSGATSDADTLPPSLPPVALGHEVAVGNGVTGTVVSLEAVDGTGQGPGNIAGPAVRATVRLTNGTPGPVSVGAVAVDMSYGSGRRPASPLDDPSDRPFTGMLAPGASAQGVYVFTVPAPQRSSVTVSVGYQAGAPFMVFTGAAR